MFLGHLIRNRHLLLTIDEHTLSCSIIIPASRTAPYELIAYQRYALSHHEIMQLRLFNITTISHHIGAFIKAHNAQHAFVSCALNGPQATPSLNPFAPQDERQPAHGAVSAVASCEGWEPSRATPRQAGLTELIMRAPEPRLSATMLMQQAPDPLIWDSCYLYPSDHTLHTFYACGLPRELLLQYDILSRMANITMSTLTSSWYAQLSLYKTMQGSAFRRANLAQTLMTHHHTWNNLLNRDMLQRMITIPTRYNHDENLPHIRTALGLFIIGNSHG